MEEFYSPVWQEYLGGVSGIVFTIIIILLFVFTFRYLRKKPISPTAPSQVPQAPDELPTVETSQPEPLLIHCPACGTEISRYAPSCLKCGHPICPTTNPRTTSPTDHNQTIIIQQPVRQSNGTGTAGFVLSLIALILPWFPGVGWVVWFLGFILSFIGILKSPRGLAITGFIISIIDLIILVALVGTLAGIASILL